MSCFRFIATVVAHHPVALSCRVLGVSHAGNYGWQGRAPSARAQADTELTHVIQAIYTQHRAVYGSPRIHAELRASGCRCGRKRVKPEGFA